MSVNVLVLGGDGVNCETETAFIFDSLGAKSTIATANALLANPDQLFEYDILALPGGFSFGDEIRSGQVLALKLSKIRPQIEQFIAHKKLIIGICNGMQVLTNLKLVKGSMRENIHGKFQNFWVKINVLDSPCVWTKGLPATIELPIRHKEGNFQLATQEDINFVQKNNLVALEYLEDVNGAMFKTAGITDPSGQILALMPHPEAATDPKLNPLSNQSFGQLIFKNAIDYIKGQK